ncbi:hypothetical protein UlMin_038845, partial [Ulmus minor]
MRIMLCFLERTKDWRLGFLVEMGRRKLHIKRIEDKHNRHVTFSKRRNGLMKKSHELSILCDVEIALVVFTGHGRLYEFCSGERNASFFEHVFPCKSIEDSSSSKRTYETIVEDSQD